MGIFLLTDMSGFEVPVPDLNLINLNNLQNLEKGQEPDQGQDQEQEHEQEQRKEQGKEHDQSQIINRFGLAGAVLLTPPPFNKSLID